MNKKIGGSDGEKFLVKRGSSVGAAAYLNLLLHTQKMLNDLLTTIEDESIVEDMVDFKEYLETEIRCVRHWDKIGKFKT